jgi:hypothetical protein
MKTKEKWSAMTRVLKPIIGKCDCCLKPNELNDLIILLKRGEKYEQMWEEHKQNLKDFRLAKTRKWKWSEEEIRLLEVKYFSEEK